MSEMESAITAASVTAIGFAKGFVEGVIAAGLSREAAIEAARAWLICATADLEDYIAKSSEE